MAGNYCRETGAELKHLDFGAPEHNYLYGNLPEQMVLEDLVVDKSGRIFLLMRQPYRVAFEDPQSINQLIWVLDRDFNKLYSFSRQWKNNSDIRSILNGSSNKFAINNLTEDESVKLYFAYSQSGENCIEITDDHGNLLVGIPNFTEEYKSAYNQPSTSWSLAVDDKGWIYAGMMSRFAPIIATYPYYLFSPDGQERYKIPTNVMARDVPKTFSLDRRGLLYGQQTDIVNDKYISVWSR